MASTYDAFISYSHAADGTLAPALESALEGFAKPWYRLRALHLFRDQTSLSATPGLWPAIEAALKGSRYFLLLASPEAADSRWVQQEVTWWLEHKSSQTLLIALTDGTIAREEGSSDFEWKATDALPLNLKGIFTETPLWVDFRWAKGAESFSTKNPQFQNALAALAAPLRNLPKENLIGEDVRQHRRTLLLARGAGVVLVLLLIAAIGAALFARSQQVEAETQRTEAVVQRDRAEEQARISLTQALAVQAVTEAERGQHERGALLARQAYLIDEANGGRVRDRADAALRATLNVPHFSQRLTGHEDWVYSVAFAPDGQTLASGSDDNTVQLWNLDHLEAAPVVLEDHRGAVNTVVFSPNGQTLTSGGSDGLVRLWDPAHLEAAPAILEGHESRVTAVAFSPDGHILASASGDGTVRLWDPAHLEAVPIILKGHEDAVTAVAFSPDGQTLASGGSHGIVRLWDLDHPGTESTLLESHQDAVFGVAFAPDGQTLASGGSDGNVRLWDLTNPAAAPVVLEGHEDYVTAVAFSSDGQSLASGSFDETVRLWNLDRLEAAPVVLEGHEDAVFSVAFAPDGRTLASAGSDGIVRLWLARMETLAELVCTQVWRNLTLDEWRQFVGDPGQIPYQPTCPELPSGETVAMATPPFGPPATPSA